MRKPLSALMSLLLVAALASCGDDDDGGSGGFGQGSGSGSAAEGSGGGGGDYCDVAEDVRDEFGDDDIDFTDPEAIEDAVDALEILAGEAPGDLEEDFELVIDAFGVIADEARDAGGDEEALDEALQEFEDEFEEVGDATERIDDFTDEECGFTFGDSGEPATDTTADDGGDGGDGGEDTSTEDFADLIADCEGGDMAACDDLFLQTPVGSEAEDIGRTCGGEGDQTTAGQCEELFG